MPTRGAQLMRHSEARLTHALARSRRGARAPKNAPSAACAGMRVACGRSRHDGARGCRAHCLDRPPLPVRVRHRPEDVALLAKHSVLAPRRAVLGASSSAGPWRAPSGHRLVPHGDHGDKYSCRGQVHVARPSTWAASGRGTTSARPRSSAIARDPGPWRPTPRCASPGCRAHASCRSEQTIRARRST